MLTYFIFTEILSPENGFIWATVPDNSLVANIIDTIWERYSDFLKGARPRLIPNNLTLHYLVHPFALRPHGGVLADMKVYQGEKRLLDPAEPVRSLPSLPEHHIVFELRISLPLPKPQTIVERAHNNVLKYVTNSAPSPSAMATESAAFIRAQKEHFLYDGRAATGPPASIYHPALARLKEDLSCKDGLELRKDMQINLLALTGKLFTAALNAHVQAEVFDSVTAILTLLNQILDVELVRDVKIYDCEQCVNHVAEFDAASRVHLRDSGEGDPAAFYVCAEFKRELGTGGAGGVQVAATYAHAAAHGGSYEPIRNVSCCPSILVSVSGPYMRFYGAVLADVVTIQPYTDYIYLGGDPDVEARIMYVAKILQSVRAAVRSLDDYYKQLSIKPVGDSIDHLLPHPTPMNEADRALLSNLHFLDRFDYPGRVYIDQNGETAENFSRPLFLARLGGDADSGGSKVLVKFCFRYGESAHRLLAQHEPPLAPRLYCCIRLLGGVTMVVMDVVGDFDTEATVNHHMPLPSGTMDEIKTALETLHDAGLVHGDLRRPNLVAVERGDGRMGAMLLDFDWAGSEGQVCYPATMNDDLHWAPGAEAARPIQHVHDLYMYDRLRLVD